MKKIGFISLAAAASLLSVGVAQASQSSVGSVSPAWELGALTVQGSAPAPYSGAVSVFNDVGGRPGKVGFTNAEGILLGRTNGAGDDGVAENAFAFKFQGFNGAQPWQLTVPFALGTKSGRDTLWTPQFRNVGIQPVHMAQFSTDNAAGDEDSRVGVIERGDFRAVDGDFGALLGCARPGFVCFQQWNGTAWLQIGRTNGPGDNGDLVSFTVLTVRTGFTLDGGGKVVNTNTQVPIAQIDGVNFGRNLGLQTPNYGNTIGTQSMLQLPRA